MTIEDQLHELGADRREEGRIMADKTMDHEGISDADIYRTQQIIRLRAVIDKLAERLREVDRALSTGGKGEHHARMIARIAMAEAAKPPTK